MSNLRPFRRRLAVSQKAISKRRVTAARERKRKARGRYPFGGPSLSTVRRWMKQAEAAGHVTRSIEHTGKRGRPPHLWTLTEKGRQHLAWIKELRAKGELPPSPELDIHVERVERLLKRARGKPMTEDQIIAAYKEAMKPAEEARREMETAQ